MIAYTLLLLFALVLIFFHPRQRGKREIKHWKKTYNLIQHEAAFQALYADINGFELSKMGRKTEDAPQYVYGEIEFTPFIALLSLCQITPATHFCDLGSGSGKAVLAACMVYTLEQSTGIEIFPLLHDAAVQRGAQLAQNPAYTEAACKLRFIQDDILSQDLQAYTLIFIQATTFIGDYWQTVSHHLERVNPGTQVISVGKALMSPHFVTHRVTFMEMSWGTVEVHIQQKIAPN